MGRASDRLSTLPDSLLFVILSKLSFIEVVQCSVLCKRWRFLHREIPSLRLSPYLLTPPPLRPHKPDPLFGLANVENIISNILQSHSGNLSALYLTNDITPWNRDKLRPWNPTPIPYPWRFTRQSISNWLECVARKNVKSLILRDFPARESPVSEALFSCTRLTFLVLYNYILTRLPTQFVGFKDLLHCIFMSIELTDDSLAAFISHCPRLGRLHVVRCDGLRRPVISTPYLRDLIVYVHGMQVLTVNCPRLTNFKNVRPVNDLRVNGLLFGELSPAIKQLEMHLGDNVNVLSLDSSTGQGEYNCPANKFQEILGSLKSLKVLEIRFLPFSGLQRMAVPVLNLLGRLPNLERLVLKEHLVLEGLHLNPTPSYLSSLVTNLQSLEIQINKCNEIEIRFLSCLLQKSPQLKNFKFTFPNELEAERSDLFLKNWTNMKKAHEEGKVPEKINEFIFYF